MLILLLFFCRFQRPTFDPLQHLSCISLTAQRTHHRVVRFGGRGNGCVRCDVHRVDGWMVSVCKVLADNSVPSSRQAL